MALNVWGMPAKVGSEDKELRISAVGDLINEAKFDVYLLAEMWMRPDHETIRQKLPPGYFMTEVGDFALSTCDGRALPTFCSGLAIVSKYPFIEVTVWSRVCMEKSSPVLSSRFYPAGFIRINPPRKSHKNPQKPGFF